MSLSELRKKNLIKEIPVDKEQIENLVSLAKRDLGVAKKLLVTDADWSFMASYNSMLQISRALMFTYGYFVDAHEKHKTTVNFMESVLGEKHGKMIRRLDRMRRKRHEALYDEAGRISEFEAKEAIAAAEEYLSLVNRKIKKRLG